MTKTNTLESKRKLIDLPVDVMSTLSDIAKGRRMSLKSYIESLAIAAAKEMESFREGCFDLEWYEF